MKTVALGFICFCFAVQTFGFYADEDGGLTIMVGNFGYYFEGQ